MNPRQPITTPGYGYDRAYPSLQGTSMAFFGYDSSANWFGSFNREASPGTAAASRQFTGKERDSESGLDYFGARYYGSALGRFNSPDNGSDQYPSDPQSWNLYSYVRNNPLGNIDSDGQTCSHAKGPNGEDIVNNLDGNGCSELYDNTVHGYENAGLGMLDALGENQNEVSAWTNVARHGIEDAALIDAGLEFPGILKSLFKGLTALLEGGASAFLRDTEGLVDAATAADPADRGGGLTKAGRALQKHGVRPGSLFPKTAGSPSRLNQEGRTIVESILSDPGKTAEFTETGRFGKTLDVYGSSGQGLRYSSDGNIFIGFIQR